MSFLDKFKNSVMAEEEVEVTEEKEEEKEAKPTKTTKKKTKKEGLKKNEDKEPESINISDEKEKDWFGQDGQLTVDVFQTPGEIYVQSAIAGVGAQDIDISVENDMLIIKGTREKPMDLTPKVEGKDYFYQECYWGSFSRQIILPAEVDSSRIEAVMKNGILTIKIPKIIKDGKKKIAVKSEDEE
jgi:HSP20 family protein